MGATTKRLRQVEPEASEIGWKSGEVSIFFASSKHTFSGRFDPMGSSARTLSFTDLRHGQRARVVCVDPSLPASLRFQELGLVCGTEFEVVKVAPLGDPVEISLRGYRLCLRRLDAEGIQVESLD